MPFLEGRVMVGSSYFWKGFILVKNLLQKGLCWKMVNGSKIGFYKDYWLKYYSLMNTLDIFIVRKLTNSLLGTKVEHFLEEGEHRKMWKEIPL